MAEQSNRQNIWRRHLSPWEMAAVAMPVLVIVILLILFYPRVDPLVIPRTAICGANLHALGRGVMIYQVEHDNLAPIDWGGLLDGEYCVPKTLVCPSSGTETAVGTEPTDLEGRVDYVLVSGMGDDTPGDLALAFELPRNHKQAGANMLREDGSVFGTDDRPHFMRRLQRTNDHLAELRRAIP